MPMHDWTKVPSGLFHDFHQTWSIQIKTSLNAGLLPTGLSALVEQRFGPKEPDVLAIETQSEPNRGNAHDGGALATVERPRSRYILRSDKKIYAAKANRIAVKHHLGRTVSVIEIVSPGNKDSRAAVRSLIGKTLEYLRAGVHVLLIDPFPPTKRDPQGMHGLIWDEAGSDDALEFASPRDRIFASYQATDELTAYLEVLGVGDVLPSMPLFLPGGTSIEVPLEETYLAAWATCSKIMQEAVITGVLPVMDEDQVE